jgi:putative inorganic carbon (HCO3(-)) transporter
VFRGVAVIVVLAVGLSASLFSPLYALWLYLWYALFRPQEWIWWDITALRVSLVLGILLVTRAFLAGAFPYVKHRLAVACILFWLTGLLAQTNAVRQDVGWLWLDFLARLIIVALLLARLADERPRFVWTMAVIAASLGFHTAKAGVRVLISGSEIRFAEGLAGAFMDNNGYALAAVMILPFIIATAQNSAQCFPLGKWIKRLFWLAAPLTCLTVVGTFSRAGFLAMIAAIFTLLILQRKRFTLVLILGAILLAAIPFIPLPRGYQHRIETIASYDEIEDSSALSRLHFWRVALNMAAVNPQGVGLRNFNYVYDKYDTLHGEYGSNRSVHNSHLQVLTENGFLGALLWLYLFYRSFRTAFSIRRRALNDVMNVRERQFLFTTSNAILASMVGFIIGGSFIALSLNDLSWLTFGLLIALDRISNSAETSVEETEAELAPELNSRPEAIFQNS